jgi:surfeit locus 1 family protein
MLYLLTHLTALIPITAFALGTWQVQRLDWKTNLIAKFEDRLVKDPLPLPPVMDPDAISNFDYRRVLATGRFRHDQEMLVGPRVHEGHDGFLVITPLEREESGSTVLVNRGWISRNMQNQKDRKEGLPDGEVTVEGLLRSPWKKNMFTPKNKPEEGKFYFPDVKEMAELTGSQPIWIEETMGKISLHIQFATCMIKLKAARTLVPELLQLYHREEKGIPIGRPPEVNLRNNHTQYIFTW